MQPTGGIQPEYKNYDRQKCFVGHSLGAEWCEDLQSACAEILPKFNLEPWYAADHFTPTQTLRDKVVELIANSRFGIYDISSWKDKDGNWQLPRNVYIELGIAIALNRPTLLLRHTSNQELQLPACLQSIKILEFAGDVTLKKALEAQLPQWIEVPPDRDWLNRFCIFGNQVCSFREKHPCAQQWGQEKIHCHISDGLDKNHSCYHQSECDEIRGAFEEVFSRYSDLNFNYMDEISIVDNYQHLLCSYCQTVRSTSFAIYRILPNTSAETFIAIGISIALSRLFDYNIPKVIFVKTERDLPSLLRGYEVVEAVNSKEIKQKLKTFLPTVLKMVRETTWRAKPLPFAETIILYNKLTDKPELEVSKNSEDKDPTNNILIEELQLSVRVYYNLKRAQIHSLADLLDYTQKDLLEIKNFGRKSLEEVVQALERRFGIILPLEKASENIDDFLGQEVSKNLLRKDIAEVLDNLEPRQRDVLRLRYGLDDGRMKTLEEIAQIFNITKQQVRIIEANALRNLRNKKTGESQIQAFSAAEEIQKIKKRLYELAQNNKITKENVLEALHQEIRQNPALKAKLLAALKAGALEAITAEATTAEAIKEWLEASEKDEII